LVAGEGFDSPRVALIGYGAIAEMHVEALAELGVRPVVVAGPKPAEASAFAARYGIADSTSDVDAAITSSDANMVVLATPSAVHAAQAAQALQAGRHVLVEIPLALSAAEGAALVRDADARGLTLMVCHTLRYWEPIDRAHAWLRDQGCEVRHVVARALSLRHENVGWTGRRRSWTDDLLWHHGGHVIDEVLRLLPGTVTTIHAAVGPVSPLSGLPMDYAITLCTDDRAVATIALSYNARTGVSDYYVITDGETLSITGADVRTSAGPVLEGANVAAVQRAAVLAQDRDFLDAVTTGRAPIAAAAAILPVLEVQQAVADAGRHPGGPSPD
jgi:2-hydroxy-4-carboxymuconate semialdehyde hemiacetal dehydrogenase